MFNTNKELLKLFTHSLLIFLLFSIVVVAGWAIAIREPFFNVWDYYHDMFMIPLFWRVIPVMVCLYAAFAVNPMIRTSFETRLGISAQYVHLFAFGICAVTFMAAAGQTLGGCIWQIPYLIMGDPNYAWKRFGYRHFPPDVLMAFYFVVSVLMGRMIKHLYINYILAFDSHNAKQSTLASTGIKQ
jgi:hypothetical protein